MINKKRKMVKVFLITGVLALIMCSLVSAVGMSLSYHDLNYLKIGPGETKDVIFGRFQNTGDVDKTLEIELVEGSEIAELTDSGLDSFIIPAGELNIPLSVRVSIPEAVAEGTEYKISVRYKDITPSEAEGMVTMSESKTSFIPVLVQKEEVPEEVGIGWIILAIVLIIAVIVVIWFIVKNRKVGTESVAGAKTGKPGKPVPVK